MTGVEQYKCEVGSWYMKSTGMTAMVSLVGRGSRGRDPETVPIRCKHPSFRVINGPFFEKTHRIGDLIEANVDTLSDHWSNSSCVPNDLVHAEIATDFRKYTHCLFIFAFIYVGFRQLYSFKVTTGAASSLVHVIIRTGQHQGFKAETTVKL